MIPASRMGEDFIQGHVDEKGVIVSQVDSLWVKVKTKKNLLKYLFIGVDGTSSTVVDVFVEEECFNFMF